MLGDNRRIFHMARCVECQFKMPFADHQQRQAWADEHRLGHQTNPLKPIDHVGIAFWLEAL